MRITGYENWSANELADRLNSAELDNMDTSTLVGAIMVLCSRVRELESKIEQVDRAAWKAGNDASCLANGIIPD